MGYASLAECVADLHKAGDLRVIDTLLDPHLEIAHVQRRAFQAGAPALLFTRPKGCRFPMLANLFGTKERVNFIFRDGLERAKALFEAKAAPRALLRHPAKAAALLPGLWRMRPRQARKAPVLERQCALWDLPQLVSWPGDGGPFITLPLVYSEWEGAGNLGMYRVQLAGNEYGPDEVGLHYQLHRGIGIHHAKALAAGKALRVNVHAGGPPALAAAAVMPLPEGMSELFFAGLLGGRRVRVAQGSGAAILADADFVLQGSIAPGLKPEGPFGDHLGYYSARHDFPYLKIESVHHREGAIWPFTTVGRPPQEDTVFGDLIHELTAPLVPQVFAGVKEVHAVDAAGVHPLLLALGSERYAPYEAARRPRELLTLAMHLLGATQTSLAKYVLIAAAEDAPGLSCRDVEAFLRHMLERADFSRDLHFITRSACDTLDYSGYDLHEGSRLVWAAAGEKRRALASELGALALPTGFANPRVCFPGCLAIEGPAHARGRWEQDADLDPLLAALERWPRAPEFPLAVVVDDADFCAAALENFLWAVFTRSDPARDCYGARAWTRAKHWGCEAPLVIDARLKAFQPAPLEDDPALVEYLETLARWGGPLEGIL